ncbi:Sulfur carrier protein FdhD [Sinobacterium norvegicum]|uniref:Sulfur carrier protein FdhD n=1 Tax=Sinobacterium norvegicum TaxID=1641715 RepID=A0ABN8ENB7_9GAMM|nr:formate dehydrogenase accessory sulfurtransferase FdhD [Sinobacterium norvegicum]CAH0992754.1 Sulfur carrier protein FdhD [Sinobacterium norvegicum]
MKTLEINQKYRCLLKETTVIDERGELRQLSVAGENPLTIYLNKREIVTIMTLGSQAIPLVLGYLRNQQFIRQYSDVISLQIDWEVNAAVVNTRNEADNIAEKLNSRTVTSGCGQGTIYGNLLEQIEGVQFPEMTISQSEIYQLSQLLSRVNTTYRSAGAVHGCAICSRNEIIAFNEDVGRHNAVDTLAGLMWIDDISCDEKIFYTTGRLTSEMVMKVAQIGIPILLSRSGVTEMGLSLAQKLNITLIARAKGRHFLIFNGKERVVLDLIDQDASINHTSA